MEINGLPLHPLMVHAAVVLGPIGALAALAYAAVPRWRDRLRLPMVALAVVATLSILAAYLSGDDLLESNPQLGTNPRVAVHQERAQLLLWITPGFGAVALLAGWLQARPGLLRTVVQALLGLAALAVLVQVVRVGDAGTRAVWGGI